MYGLRRGALFCLFFPPSLCLREDPADQVAFHGGIGFPVIRILCSQRELQCFIGMCIRIMTVQIVPHVEVVVPFFRAVYHSVDMMCPDQIIAADIEILSRNILSA